MKYELLNNMSGALVLLVLTAVFSLMFETRYPLKKYLASLVPFLVVLFGINFFVIFHYGFGSYGKVTLLLATVPSLIYFYAVSLHRDGRFFFTFCLVDTCSIWFVLLTGFIDYFSGSEGLVNFIIRLASGPVIIYAVARGARRPFLSMLHTVQKGWWLFTAITAMVYLILVVMTGVPTSLRERPDDIPLAFMILIFLPFSYATIFYVLLSQQKIHEMETQKHAFSVQTAMIAERAEELKNAEEKMRIERHDFRHRLKIIEEFAKNGESEEALAYLGDVQEALGETDVTHYCSNPIIDAILSSYFRKAESSKITVETRLSIPDELPVPAAELATVFANALDNAIHACLKLPEEKREIICTCIHRPSLMFEVKNPYTGEIRFDAEGLPISEERGHGIGSRSIAAFCKKYDATYIYEAKDGTFSLKIGL